MTVDRRSFLALAAGGLAATALAACGASGDGEPAAAGDASTTTAPADGASTSADPTAAGAEPTSGDDGRPGEPATGPSGDGDGTVGTWVVRGSGERRQVALTFHTDGPTSMVESVLDIVEDRDVAITTFIVGSWLDANPALGARLVDGGHDLANHTYTHPTFESLTPAQMQSEIDRCRAALERHTGTAGRWFRPSGTDNGIDSPSSGTLDAAGRAGYTAIGYDVDPIDYRDPGAAAVVDRTMAAVEAGSIVSLHMGHQGTIDALPTILDRLEAEGLEPVTVSVLLG